MEKFFLRIYDFFARGRRKWAFIIPGILALIFAGAACLINMNEDIAGFLPYGSGKAHRQSQFIYKNLRMADKVMVIISADDMRHYQKTADDSLAEEFGDTLTVTDKRINVLTRAADDFSDRYDMSGIKGVKDAQTRIDAVAYMNVTDFLVSNMPYFLEKEDYDRADSIIAAGGIADILKEDRSQILSPQGTVLQQGIVSDPLHFSKPILERLGKMGMDSDYKIIGDYLFTGDSTRIIMTLTSAYGGSETRKNKQLVKSLEKIRDSVTADNKGVKVDFLGAPVIAVTNSVRMHKDSVRCSMLALLLIILLLGWYFRKLKPIILICIPVVFGVLFGLAWMGLFQTSVSTIALSASSIILGIGVDYALVYSTRLGFVGNSRQALKDIVSPMVTGNITTVGAFFSLLVMSAAGMRDFGLFAAISLIGVILFVVIFLPHWVGEKQYKSIESGWMGRWTNLKMEEKNWIVWGVVIATVILFFFSQRVKFNGDFNKINYMTSRQRADMEEFNAHTSAAGNVAVYAVAQGNTMDQALTQYESLRSFANKTVGSKVSLQSKGLENFLPSRKTQGERIAMWNAWVDKHRSGLNNSLESNASSAGFSKDAFAPFRRITNKEFLVHDADYFKPLTSTLLSGYILKDTTGKALILTILYTPEKNLPKIYKMFDADKNISNLKKIAQSESVSGKHHHESVNEPFLFDSFSMTDEMIDVLQGDFNWVLFLCSFLVFGFLWWAFGRVETALIAFLPMVVSWIWITGLMGLFGTNFNIVNIILATFIFGMGDDYTIFIVDGCAYEYAYNKKLLASYKTSVTLSAITMLIGIGSLVFAVHPAMRSLGEVAIIGMICVVAMAFVLPPLLFRWITACKYKGTGSLRFTPVKLIDMLVSAYCAIVFFCVSLWLNVKCMFISERDTSKLHKSLQNTAKFIVRHMPRVEHMLINESNETFEKPSVIICNHQSHLDLMYLLQLSPKIIVLTNHWVWHSPFYGKIIRKAQFISVEDGFENCVGPLKQLVNEGYSIVIFPEGTRSADCSILPFHNGAFYLAEKLNLDIVPVIFHGIGHVLPKREMIFRKGSVVTKILPRVSSEDLKSGIKYGEKPLRTAQIFRQMYIKEYASLVKERENFAYLYDRIRGFYMYKGSDILKAADEELAVLKNYPGHAWNAANDGSFDAKVLAIPHNGTVCYKDCRMGVEPLAVALMRDDVKVMISADNDEDEDLLRVISENCGGNLLFGKASKEPVPEEIKETDDMPEEPMLF